MSDERFVEAPPAGADAWRQLWQEDRRYRPAASRHEWFLRIVRRIVRRATEPDAERQKNFNLAVLDLVDGFRRDLATLRSELRADIEALQQDVRKADEALAGDLRNVHTLLHERIGVAARRNDALVAALDQKIETVGARVRDLTNPLVTGAQSPAVASDFLYRRIEDALRGSEADVRAAVAPYVEIARSSQPLFDVGCGRGELLLACREAGVEARGCDTNERSVADLVRRGADVSLAGVPGCLDSIAPASLGSIAALHVVEHLPVEALFAFFRESARVLRGGGMLMIETPNAESLLVSASEFWRDPTHLAPRHPAALTVLAHEHGFEIAEVRAVHEFPEGTRIAVSETDPPELRRVVEAINARMFAPQDLRLVLRKK